ncbi:MAG TPA: hypothetical protein PLS49_05915 [Candidatus Woesebacteria bacterium]|nr:hypothetical protein [Candidatus Woesebacteria bacterium]
MLNETRGDTDGVTWMPLKDGLAKMGEKIRNTAQLGVGLSALRAKELLEKLKSKGEVVDELDESIRKSKQGKNSKNTTITPQEAKNISENLRDTLTGSNRVQTDNIQSPEEANQQEIMLSEEDLAALQQLIRDFNDTEKVDINESDILRQQILKKQLFYFSQYLDQNEEWLTRLINELQPGFELNSIKEKKAFANYIDPFDDEKTVAEGFNLLGVSNILEELYTKLQQLPPEKQAQVETNFSKLYSFVSELTLVQIYFPEQINSLTWQEAMQKGVAQKTSLLLDLEKNGINVDEHDLYKPLVSQSIWSYDPALVYQPSLYGGNYNWIKNYVHLKPEAAKKYMNILKEKNDNSTENNSTILVDQSQPDAKSETNLSGENVLVDQQTKIDEIRQRAEQLKAQTSEISSTIPIIERDSPEFQEALNFIGPLDEVQVHRLQRQLGIDYDKAKGILQTLEQEGYVESGGEIEPRKVIKKQAFTEEPEPAVVEQSDTTETVQASEATLPIPEQDIGEKSFRELSQYVQEMREKIRETYLKGTNEPDGILQELNKKYIEMQHIMMEQWFKENMQLVEIVSKHHHNSEDFVTLFRKQLLSEHRIEEAIYQIHNVQNEMRYVNKKEQVNLTKFIESFKKAIETIEGGTLIDLQEYIGKTKADINKDGIEYKEFSDVSLLDNTNRFTDQAKIIGVELGFDPNNPLSQRIMPTIIFGAPSNY